MATKGNDERTLTRQGKKYYPVNDQNGPEDRYIKDLKPGADKSNQYGARRTQPKLKLGQSSDERAVLLILLRR